MDVTFSASKVTDPSKLIKSFSLDLAVNGDSSHKWDVQIGAAFNGNGGLTYPDPFIKLQYNYVDKAYTGSFLILLQYTQDKDKPDTPAVQFQAQFKF